MNKQMPYQDSLLDVRTLASELLAQSVLRGLAAPAYYFDGELLAQTAQEQGGFAVTVPARRQPFQLPMGLGAFFGITCERNANESHHFHPHQVEIYIVMKGVLRLETWLGLTHKEFLLQAGDALVVPPGSCHHLTEWIEPGVAYVLRSPNDITGEAAKIVCDESKHCRQEQGVRLEAA
jgi:mannose-6-phosphate isomerase-like protein (cupin superfamily)